MSRIVDEDDIILQYLYLCENPLRDDDQVLREYEELKHNSRVTNIAFLRPDVLMVGTDKIVVQSEGVKYLVGEMIIFLIRRKVDGYWEVDFRFWNVTNPIYIDDTDYSPENVNYIHPHIKPTYDDVLGVPNGALCIQSGQFSVYQYLRKGEMHLVVPRLIEILETYPTGTPYGEASTWPEWHGEVGEKNA